MLEIFFICVMTCDITCLFRGKTCKKTLVKHVMVIIWHLVWTRLYDTCVINLLKKTREWNYGQQNKTCSAHPWEPVEGRGINNQTHRMRFTRTLETVYIYQRAWHTFQPCLLQAFGWLGVNMTRFNTLTQTWPRPTNEVSPDLMRTPLIS